MNSETEAVLDRTDFLARNTSELIRQMRRSNIPDPVGVVADVRDFHGRQFALSQGMTDAEIDRHIAEHQDKGQIPTIIAVITWATAKVIMPYTSPSASQNLAAAEMLCATSGKKLMIAIMGRGNRYVLVDIRSQDGGER